MTKYSISGMSCSACQARIQREVSSLDGVQSCEVNLLTNSMTVQGSTPEEIISKVESVGYGAELLGQPSDEKKSVYSKTVDEKKKMLHGEDTSSVLKRLCVSAVFLVVLMYFSMGHMMHLPSLPFFKDNFLANGIVQLLLCIVIMFVNRKFFINGFKAMSFVNFKTKKIIKPSPNMDSLIAIGSSVSFAYSVVILFSMTTAKPDAMMSLNHRLYFEDAAMILTFVTIGKYLESYSKGKTTSALQKLLDLSPKTAKIKKDGETREIDIDLLKVGDTVCVSPGEEICCDGVVTFGTASVDESSLTGESIPRTKTVGDSVSSGTTNTNGYIELTAQKVGEDSTLAKIIQMVTDAGSSKAPAQKLADKISAVFVPVVISISLVTFCAWLLSGHEIGFSIARAVTVLVVSCPCALGLATPVAIMVGNGVGARNGILFKNASSLQNLCKSDTVLFDKTGTITEGKPKIVDLYCPSDEKKTLQMIYTLEKHDTHPLSKAVCTYCEENGISNVDEELSEFSSVAGKGINGVLGDTVIYGGNVKYIEQIAVIDDDSLEKINSYTNDGKTVMVFAKIERNENGKILCVMSCEDKIKQSSIEAISALKKMNIKTVMITGDTAGNAKRTAEKLNIDEYYAETLPGDKDKIVQKYLASTSQKSSAGRVVSIGDGEPNAPAKSHRGLSRSRSVSAGRVVFVGDGINDSVALARADIGIAIGSGTDIAIDSADVVLMNSSLNDVVRAINLSRRTYRTIKQGLFWALIYNCLLIPFAAGVPAFLSWLFKMPSLNVTLSPMIGSLAMSLSSVFVVTNALRLNTVNIDKNLKSYKKRKGKEKTTMTKEIKIEGMMCPHCEMHVKNALENIDGVVSATPSHEKANAVLVLEKDVDDEVLREAVQKAGYEMK